jgi:hypothetical protein
VRAFQTPSVAALLGRWFWWPQQVRPRPASALLRSSGPRPLVRALLLREQSGNGKVAGPNGQHTEAEFHGRSGGNGYEGHGGDDGRESVYVGHGHRGPS